MEPCKAGYEKILQKEFRERREANAYAAFASAQPDVASAASPTVLTDQYEIAGSGTAFFVTPDGHLITNKHVVEGCDVMTLVASNGLHLLLVLDTVKLDLAILKASQHVDQFALFTTRQLRVGENVYAIGFPLLGELGGVVVTDGIISSLVGPLGKPQYLQISAPIQPGNSGGPLVDQHGTIAGVVTAKDSGPVGDAFLEGVGFAVRPSLVMALMLNNGVEPLLWTGGPTATPNIAEFVTTFTYPVLCWTRKGPVP
jgi:S1-C subfamily serine protease